jgi:RHS repeat-associated protein
VQATASAYGGAYKWTGRQCDPEEKLQYNRGRYYDAATGRWTSQDPLGFDAGDCNLFRYVQNQTTSAVDPSGTDLSSALTNNPLNAYFVPDNYYLTRKVSLQTNVSDVRATYRQQPAPNGEGFDRGLIYSTVNASLQGEPKAEKARFFLAAYQGPKASKIRWLQLFQLHILPIVEAGKGKYEIFDPEDVELPIGNDAWPRIKSSQTKSNVYIDTTKLHFPRSCQTFVS